MIDLVVSSTEHSGILPPVTVHGPAVALLQVAAALATASYAMNSFGRGRRRIRRSAVLIALLCVLAACGAAWVVQSGAGIALWGLSTVAFANLRKITVRRRLLVSMAGLLIFGALGADWVFYPVAFFVVLRLWNLLGHVGTGCGDARQWPAASKRCGRPVELHKQPLADPIVPGSTTPGAEAGIETQLGDLRLPADARDLLRQIVDRSSAASGYLDQQGRGSGLDAIEVDRIRGDYAPGAVHGYLALPRWSADDAVLADGKTGAQLLIEQLGLLVRRLREIQDSVAVTGGTELLTHGQFLKHRFASGGSDDLHL